MAPWKPGYYWDTRKQLPERRYEPCEVRFITPMRVMVRFADGLEVETTRPAIKMGEPPSPLVVYLERSREEIGQRVMLARLDRDMSQAVLGEAIGLGQRTVYAIERGARPLLPAELRAVCRAFNCEPAALLGDDAPADVLAEAERVVGRLASLLDADADWLHDEAMAGRLPDRCHAVAERIRAALRSEAYNEAHAAPADVQRTVPNEKGR